MLENILKLKSSHKLTKDEQKAIYGGTPVQPANCKCFCVVGGERVETYCYAWCPGGSLPGIYEGSPSTCTTPMPPLPPGIE